MTKTPRQLARGLCYLIELLAILAGGLRLLAALDARALIMLTLANLGQDAGPGTLALKTLESALKGFVFPNADFRHCFPSPRAYRDATPGIY